MRLYHHPMSSNARRAVMTAMHLGQEVELFFVDLSKGEQRTLDFLCLNPNGRVPVLVDDGFVLTESLAIMQYLADKTPGQTVYPQPLRARADVNRWLFWGAQHFQPGLSVLVWERVIRPRIELGGAGPREEQRGEALVAEALRLLDAHLEGRPWVVLDRLTLADLSLAAPLMYVDPARISLVEYPNVRRWLTVMQALPAWQRTNL